MGTDSLGPHMNRSYIKRLIKVIAELCAIAITVALLQVSIDWFGFEAVWPILAAILVVLIIVIASMGKQ